MRVIECSLCGQLLQAGDDEELVQVAMRHMSADHEEAQVGEDQVRGMVERNAYTATDA
jgi:predicted small metal-binding protein